MSALVTVHDDDGDDDMRWRKCIMALVIVPDDDTFALKKVH